MVVTSLLLEFSQHVWFFQNFSEGYLGKFEELEKPIGESVLNTSKVIGNYGADVNGN